MSTASELVLAQSAHISAIWLGAGKRVQILEQFHECAQRRGITLSVCAVESSQFVPIARFCDVVPGPKFSDEKFGDFLIALIRERQANLILPFMDSATVALSKMSERIRVETGAIPMVSDAALCRVMEDKLLADGWFSRYDVAKPPLDRYPMLLKPRLGFAARDHHIAHSPEERRRIESARPTDYFFAQSIVQGPEYTIDAYVGPEGHRGHSIRRRWVVVGGEVEQSEIVDNHAISALVERVCSVMGWFGPITLQVIQEEDGSLSMIEINPRFGGGATHSIAAGLPIIDWVFDDVLGCAPTKFPGLMRNRLMTRYRKDVYHDPGH